MPTPITRPPLGLLDLVGTKTLGLNPNQLLDQVRPQIDIQRLTLLSRYEVLSDLLQPIPFPLVPGFNANFTVPQGELWYVHCCTAWAVIGAGAAAAFAIAAGLPSSGQIPYTSSIASRLANAAISAYATDWWLPSGFGLGLLQLQSTVGASTYDIHAMVTKLQT